MATTKKKTKPRVTTKKKTTTKRKTAGAKKTVNTAALNKEQITKYGDEPWVDVKAMVYDPKKGAKVELDWNDAFIEYLRDNGFTGVDENAIIQKYIAVLLRNVVTDMETDRKNEFE